MNYNMTLPEENWYKIICPYTISIPRKTKEDKVYPINLNSYRNWLPIVSNNIKKEYHAYMLNQCNNLPHFKKIYIVYKPFYAKWWKHDKGNVLSITQKFFLDALVHSETIDDDSDWIVMDELFMAGSVDKDNPRVEVIIFDNKRDFKEYIKKVL